VDKFLNLFVSGLVTGAIYSIMASGLVLTYTTSGIFNFAHGAVAFATAYLYYQLHVGWGVPIVPSLIISVFVFAPLLGLALDRLLLRRLARAPAYARIVGTIGLLVMLPALIQWIFVTIFIKIFGWDLPGNTASTQGVPVPGIGPNPPHIYKPFAKLVLSSDQLAVFIVAAIAALVLWYVIRRTRLGLEMRAVVDRDTLAGLRGVNAARTSAVAWIMTMILAGLGGVLIAPLFTLSEDQYTLVVLGSLAVVVLGGLRSIPIAFAGGLALGVVQNMVAGYKNSFLPDSLSNLTGLNAAVPFVLTAVLLLVLGRDKSRRAGSVADDVPKPDHRRGMPAWRRRLPWVIWTVILVGFAFQWSPIGRFRADNYSQTVIANGLAVAIIFLSFVVVTGMGGMVSLSQATFVTAGGFAAGWALTWHWPDIPVISPGGNVNWILAVAVGAIVAAIVGALIALPLTRLGGVSLALGTLAFAFVAWLVIFPLQTIGNGENGWAIRAPTWDVPVVNQVVDFLIRDKQNFFDSSQLSEQILLFLVLFGLITLAIHALQRSATGRAILAVRSSEVAAEASGIRVQRYKVLTFALAGGIAGVGGACLGLFSFQIDNAAAPPLVGLFWLALAVTFGVRRPGGALLAGLAFTAGTAVFHWVGKEIPGGSINDLVTSVYFVPILSGLGAIQLAQEPDGILSMVGHRKLEKQRAKRRAEILAAEAAAHGGTVPEHERDMGEVSVPDRSAAPALESQQLRDSGLALQNIVAGYGDVEVLHGVSLALERGTVTALLGANGAGKSTLCGVAAGIVPPEAGSVWLSGADVTKQQSHERAKNGLLLVPEARGIFPGLTVEENLMLLLADEDLRQKAYDRFPILWQRRGQVAGLLSGGEQQMLSLAPAMASPPTVLIADEPTLGLAPMAAEGVMEAILELRAAGSAVLLVEEHASNALKVADTIAYKELGRLSWLGPRQEADMEQLAGAYLGSIATA
jgi:branched-subunit amino acid ABC-type transport system permease component/ABC-type branched-subunit amino acid transport system ATPase component